MIGFPDQERFLPGRRSVTMLYARYVSRRQPEGSPAELSWLDQYVVDSFSGLLPADRVSQAEIG